MAYNNIMSYPLCLFRKTFCRRLTCRLSLLKTKMSDALSQSVAWAWPSSLRLGMQPQCCIEQRWMLSAWKKRSNSSSEKGAIWRRKHGVKFALADVCFRAMTWESAWCAHWLLSAVKAKDPIWSSAIDILVEKWVPRRGTVVSKFWEIGMWQDTLKAFFWKIGDRNFSPRRRNHQLFSKLLKWSVHCS